MGLQFDFAFACHDLQPCTAEYKCEYDYAAAGAVSLQVQVRGQRIYARYARRPLLARVALHGPFQFGW